MPTYTYRCLACQQEMTVQQGMNDSKTQVCEACGGIARPVIVSAPVVLNAELDIQDVPQAVETSQQECTHDHSACVHHRHPPAQ